VTGDPNTEETERGLAPKWARFAEFLVGQVALVSPLLFWWLMRWGASG
jgi:hypothetical protein